VNRRTLLLAAAFAAVGLPAMAAHSGLAGALMDPSFDGLLTQKGRPISEAVFKGRYRLVFFGYTHCPDVCPLTLYTMKLILTGLGRDADRLRPVYVTVDPARDTPKVLGDYIGNFDSRIIGLTGPEKTIARVADRYGAIYMKTAQHSATDYMINHTSRCVLVGPDHRVVDIYELNADPQVTAAEIVKQLRSGAVSGAH
jgi:protein SCO1/2